MMLLGITMKMNQEVIYHEFFVFDSWILTEFKVEKRIYTRITL